MRRHASFLAVAIAVTSAAVASATPVTVQFSGVIGTPFNDSRDLTGGAAGPGTSFSGTYTVDPATPGRPNTQRGPNQYTYYFDAEGFIQLTVGSLDLSTFLLTTWVSNDRELSDGSGLVDSVEFSGLAEVEEAFGGIVEVILYFHDPTGTVFDTEALVAAPTVSRFEGTLIASSDTSALLIVGSIDSISIVPEPGTALLVSLGLVVFGARRVGRRPAG